MHVINNNQGGQTSSTGACPWGGGGGEATTLPLPRRPDKRRSPDEQAPRVDPRCRVCRLEKNNTPVENFPLG